jgi:hypothetical protein
MGLVKIVFYFLCACSLVMAGLMFDIQYYLISGLCLASAVGAGYVAHNEV